MSEEKQIEQEIGWYKIVFAVLAAIDVSILAWLAKNYNEEEPILLVASFMAIIVVSISIVFINKNVFNLLNKLKDL